MDFNVSGGAEPAADACGDAHCEEAGCGEEFDQEAFENPCCAKDRKEQAEADRIKAVLNAHCPVQKLHEQRTLQLSFQALGINASEDDHDSLDSLEDEDDAELLRWRTERMGQMEREFGKQKELRLEGHGTYTEVKERNLGKELEDGPERLVCHFYVQGTAVASTVDELMDSLAHAHLSTKFVRVHLDRSSSWPTH
eukprot:CAMPEP_0118952152 /NCGR_PEP_ID=MMETSP1169-20130426/54373_1 /TAXON_ID=36882 /ORGANISM="Pyramimonas obovata, Strain CCMP722" /LENGTH=195 /DNA_ID=CAMNT_0006899331 /DNA_START=34 /DNA_END=618 /DNA_ORIENTATION=+